MNYLTLAQRLRQEAGVQGSGPTTTESQSGVYLRLVNWINASYQEIQNLWVDWNFLWEEGTLSTVASSNTIARPSTVASFFDEGFYYNAAPIAVMEWDEFRSLRDSYTGLTGAPELLVKRLDGNIGVYPTPDAVYSIRYEASKRADVFTGNASEPIWDERYHMVIVWKALMHYALYENAKEVLQEASMHYSIYLKSLESKYLPHNEHRYRSQGNNIVVTPQ